MFLQFKNFSWQDNGSEGDLEWTPVIILMTLFVIVFENGLPIRINVA